MAGINPIGIPIKIPNFSKGPIDTINEGLKSMLPHQELMPPPMQMMHPIGAYPGEPATPHVNESQLFHSIGGPERNPFTGASITPGEILNMTPASPEGDFESPRGPAAGPESFEPSGGGGEEAGEGAA